MTRTLRALCVAMVASSFLAPSAASAQTSSVTSSDIQRLQEKVYSADRDLSELRTHDAARAAALQTELDDVRDEVVYLKVKLRKEQTLSRNEYTDVSNHIDGIRSRARDDAAVAATGSSATSGDVRATSGTGVLAPARPASAASPYEIPAGTQLDVRLQTMLNSGTAQVEDRFEATTVEDLSVGERTLVPAGSIVHGIVTAVEPATRTNRTAKMTVVFDQLTVGSRTYDIRGTLTDAIEGSGIKGEAARIGVGAGVGAVIGGIIGGVKGALAGVLIGGGGTVAATEGKEVELPQGSVLRVRIDSPVTLRPGR